MIQYEVEDGHLVVDAFNPKKVLAVCFDKATAKKIRDLLNKTPEKTRKKDTSKQELINLRAKMARWQKILEENDLMPKPGRRHRSTSVDPKQLLSQLDSLTADEMKATIKKMFSSHDRSPFGIAPDTSIKVSSEGNVSQKESTTQGTAVIEKVKKPRAKMKFKEKTCPGYKREPHQFTPTAGNQTHCPECRRHLLADKMCNQQPAPKTNIVTITRGSTGGFGSNVQRIPTVEEVLAMENIEERRKWEARWSPAEQQYAMRIKTKIERERWKQMRNKPFATDHPIMGCGLKLGPK